VVSETEWHNYTRFAATKHWRCGFYQLIGVVSIGCWDDTFQRQRRVIRIIRGCEERFEAVQELRIQYNGIRIVSEKVQQVKYRIDRDIRYPTPFGEVP
jgi:hypothetical protein